MRVWIGKEMEWKNKGIMTAFVETAVLDKHNLDNLYNILIEHKEVEAVYFGAGRKNINSIDYMSFNNFLSYCVDRSSKPFKTTMETSKLNNTLFVDELVTLINKYNIMMIFRIDTQIKSLSLNLLLPQIVYKIDNCTEVIFTSFKQEDKTDITTVKNGLYKKEDILIYSEKENK